MTEARTFLLTGVTGFLGKVWLAMLLDRYPEIGTLYTVVRARKTISSEERWWSEIAPSPVFDPLRAKHPDYDRWIATKVVAIAGTVVPSMSCEA